MRWLRYTLGALIALLIGVGILLPASTFVAPAFGFQLFAVRGHSMSPTIPMGSLIAVSERDPGELRPGDIVTWRGDNGVWVTHRVVQIVEENGETFVQTRGDANAAPDAAAVPGGNIRGVVDGWIPIAGFALVMLATPTGLVSWLSFGLALLVLDTVLAGMAPAEPAARPARRTSRLRDRLTARRTDAPAALPIGGTGWPVHFEGVTVDGHDLAILDDMQRCADGDHRRCAAAAARGAISWPAADTVR